MMEQMECADPEEPAMRAIIRRLSDRLSSRELAKGYVSVR